MKYQNQVRIIAGKWRGRKINFISQEQLRPSGDRIRETLFNWLMRSIVGAHCLDLFAGSGALGFEALSRGAQHVTMIDNDFTTIKQLSSNVELLQAQQQTSIHHASIPTFTLPSSQTFDVIFLDPPFQDSNAIAQACQWLLSHNLLKTGTLVYIEVEKKLQDLSVPETWQQVKVKQVGNVKFYLYKV